MPIISRECFIGRAQSGMLTQLRQRQVQGQRQWLLLQVFAEVAKSRLLTKLTQSQFSLSRPRCKQQLQLALPRIPFFRQK